MKFKIGDIVKTQGSSFEKREILGTDDIRGIYLTKFIEDNSVVETPITTIDSNYFYAL